MSEHDGSRLSELIHEMRNQLAVAKANLEAFIDGKLAPTAERLEQRRPDPRSNGRAHQGLARLAARRRSRGTADLFPSSPT